MTYATPPALDDRVRAADVQRLVAAVQRLDLDLDGILAASDTVADYQSIADKSADTMSKAAHAAFYREAMLRIEALATRASGRAPITADDYALMWQSAITCRTLRAVIERIATFSRLLDGRMGAIQCDVRAGTAVFTLDPMRKRRSAASFVAEMIGMTMFTRMFSWLVGEEIAVQELVFDYGQDYEVLLDLGLQDRPVRLGGRAILVRFPADFLDMRVIRTAEELDALLPLSLVTVSPQPRAGPYSRRVLRLVDEAISEGTTLPGMGALSVEMACSAASLRRWLEDEGTSLRELKRQRRQEWAIELLRRPGSSVTDIASRLGFSDETAFRRAFKTWLGVPPSAFQTAPRPPKTGSHRSRPARTVVAAPGGPSSSTVRFRPGHS